MMHARRGSAWARGAGDSLRFLTLGAGNVVETRAAGR